MYIQNYILRKGFVNKTLLDCMDLRSLIWLKLGDHKFLRHVFVSLVWPTTEWWTERASILYCLVLKRNLLVTVKLSLLVLQYLTACIYFCTFSPDRSPWVVYYSATSLQFFWLDHVFPDIFSFNSVKKETAVKTIHHCSHSSTVFPQVSGLYTGNSPILTKKPSVFHGL